MESPAIHKGMRFLNNYLRENNFDFRHLDLAQFKSWLNFQLRYKQRDESFVQRCKIRDLKKQQRERLAELGGKLKHTQEKWLASPHREELEKLEGDIANSEKAIVGLGQAVQQRTGDKREACVQKLGEFRQKLAQLQQRQKQILQQTPEKSAFDAAEQELIQFHEQIGLTQDEAHLRQLLKEQGRKGTRAGDSFEDTAHLITRKCIYPIARRKCKEAGILRPKLQTLSQVKLGCARAELDHVVITEPTHADSPVEVLAIIEVKRNINDVASGFATRQENIAWFTQNGEYDPALYRTKIFREGHFDRSAYHEENGVQYLFTSDSFRHFHQEQGYFLDGLYFITTNRSRMRGMRTDEYAKIIYRIATDVRFDLENEMYLEDLRQWSQSLVCPRQTREVIELYAKKREWGQQFIIQEKS